MKKGERYFTLLELLIVISIMIILMSLLLPALRKARESGQKTECQGNLRQIGLAMACYSSDNNEWILPAAPYAVRWYRQLWVLGYVPNYKIYHCSAETKTFDFCEYAVNYFICGNSAWIIYPPHKLSYLTSASQAIMVTDNNEISNYAVSIIYPDKIAYRHNGRANILYGDNHLAAKVYDDLNTTAFGSGALRDH